jgi:sulfur-oxidizing protein SoxY
MDEKRRDVLKTGGGLTLLSLVTAAGWLATGDARADWNKAAFETKSLDETVKAVGGSAAAPSKDITFFATPDIAENGAVVPVGVASAIPKTESIAILIEKNPNMMAAMFEIPPGTDPSISTRVKMGQSSNVYALVKADGKFYVASKEIKVTLGGCGG